MSYIAARSSASPLVAFSAWSRTCREFAAAIAVGPGLVALVGPEGSGKTTTLKLFATTLSGQRAKMRVAGSQIDEGVTIDLIDVISTTALGRLRDEPPFHGVRAVAVRPEWLSQFSRFLEGARIVHMQPMSDQDVRVMTLARQKSFELGDDTFTYKAVSSLVKYSDGNPRKVDYLFNHALRAAHGTKCSRVSSRHVIQAAEAVSVGFVAQRTKSTDSAAALQSGGELPTESPRSQGDTWPPGERQHFLIPMADGAKTDEKEELWPEPLGAETPVIAEQSSDPSTVPSVLDVRQIEDGENVHHSNNVLSAWDQLSRAFDPLEQRHLRKTTRRRARVRAARWLTIGLAITAAVAFFAVYLPSLSIRINLPP